jgi:pre-mRNA-splicing factor RBM22/SLT11
VAGAPNAFSVCAQLNAFRDARSYKKTVICREVALAKNVCQARRWRRLRACGVAAALTRAARFRAQCCVLDLDTGLPVQVRDAALGVSSDPIPQSDVGKEYAVAQIAAQARARSLATLRAAFCAARSR